MKKFLKVVLVLLLVAGAVGATCYFFFTNLKKNQNIYADVNAFIYNANQTDFADDLTYVKGNGGARFETLININSNLKDTAVVLNSYLNNSQDKGVEQAPLCNALKKVEAKKHGIETKVSEYKDKCESSGFNKLVGANALFNEYINYFSAYANFLLNLREATVKVVENPKVDVKFAVVEVYLNVVVYDLSETETSDDITNLKHTANLNLINSNYSFKNASLVVPNGVDAFSIVSNNFNTKYEVCNKTQFAKSLAENVVGVSELSTSLNKEQVATYYFKELFNL